MRFKEPRIEDEFNGAPLLLKIMLIDADHFCQTFFKKEITVTRVLGKIEGDSGVHADYRAVDVRDEYQGNREFTEFEVKRLIKHINQIYARNDGFSSVIHHSFKGGPYHFHFQIAVLTKSYMPDGMKN